MATSIDQSKLLPAFGAEQDLRVSEISEIWQIERKVDLVRFYYWNIIKHPSDLLNSTWSKHIAILNMNFQSFESLFTVHASFCLKLCMFCFVLSLVSMTWQKVKACCFKISIMICFGCSILTCFYLQKSKMFVVLSCWLLWPPPIHMLVPKLVSRLSQSNMMVEFLIKKIIIKSWHGQNELFYLNQTIIFNFYNDQKGILWDN